MHFANCSIVLSLFLFYKKARFPDCFQIKAAAYAIAESPEVKHTCIDQKDLRQTGRYESIT
jgi:hypothetical protein